MSERGSFLKQLSLVEQLHHRTCNSRDRELHDSWIAARNALITMFAAIRPPACPTCRDTKRVPRSYSGGDAFEAEVACPDCAGPSRPPAAAEVVVARGTMQDLDVCDDDLRTTVIIDALASNRPDLIALDGTEVEVIIRPTAARGERKK